MEESLSEKFMDELKSSVVSLEFDANSGKNNMYTAKEKNADKVIPRGGVILGQNGKIGSRYYKYEDILGAMEEFSRKLNEQTEVVRGENHEVTSTKKSEIDVNAFIETIRSALRVYVEKNEKIVNQDARTISMDVSDDTGGKTKMTKGGMFVGKEETGLGNGEYVSEEDIKLAVNEVISEVNKEDEKITEDDQEKKHMVTGNKGKSKNNWWKKVVVVLTTMALSLSISHAVYAPGIGDDSKVYVKEIETVNTDRNIVLDVNSNYEDGIGATFEVQEELRYGQDTRKELNENLKGNQYVATGDTCQIDGISINDMDTGDIVTSAYGEEGPKNIDIYDFIKGNAPTSGGTYKVYVHIKQVEQDGYSTRLGWVNAGMAKDTGIIEKGKETEYIIVEEKDGKIEDITQTKRLPEGLEYSYIEKAPDEIRETVENYSDNKTSNEEINDMEER